MSSLLFRQLQYSVTVNIIINVENVFFYIKKEIK